MYYDEEQVAKRREYQRQYRQERRTWCVEHNMCVSCGKSKPAKGRVRCLDCLEIASAYAYTYRARLKAQGR